MPPQPLPLPVALPSSLPDEETQRNDPRSIEQAVSSAFKIVYSGQIRLSIRTIDETTINIVISPSEKVLSLKERITEQLKVPVEAQRLLYSGMMLDSERSLSEYSIQSDSIILLSGCPKLI